MTGVIFGAIDSPFHSSDLSEDISLYPNFISSFCRADMRSVSFILRVCRPVNLNGSPINQLVTTRVWAKSGCSDRSCSYNEMVLSDFLSFMPS